MGLVAIAAPVAAQDTVNIEVPSAIYFYVTDVSISTSAGPGPATVIFANANLSSGRALRVSVQADAASFTSPGGPSIPTSKVSWTSVGAAGGTGWSGTLSSSSYALVLQSDVGRTSGYVDLDWTLAPPGSGIRAGDHQLTIRWKVESITP